MYCSGFESKIRLKLLLIYWSPWLKTMPTLQSPSSTRKKISSVSLETYVHQNSKACVNSKVCPKVAQEINWSKISRVVWQSIITSKIQSKIQSMIQSMHHIHEFTHHPIHPRHIWLFIPRSIHYSIKYQLCYSIQDATHDSIQNPSHCPIQDPINDPSVMFWIFWPWSHNLAAQKSDFWFEPWSDLDF